jgi:hypothetical protein
MLAAYTSRRALTSNPAATATNSAQLTGASESTLCSTVSCAEPPYTRPVAAHAPSACSWAAAVAPTTNANGAYPSTTGAIASTPRRTSPAVSGAALVAVVLAGALVAVVLAEWVLAVWALAIAPALAAPTRWPVMAVMSHIPAW